MSMIVMCGFESGSVLEIDMTNDLVNSSVKRGGNYSLYHGMSTSYATKNIPVTTELYMQYAVYFQGMGSGAILQWRKGTTVLGYLYFDATLKICKLYVGATMVATGTKVFNPNTWYVFELHIKIADAGGVVEFRVDGLTDMSYSGDTQPGADTTIDNFNWPGQLYLIEYLDDIIVNTPSGSVNNSWPNGLKIVLLKPNGAGSSTQWTPSAGSNYQCVDEVPVSQTDYVYVNADGQLDLYTMEDLPAEAKSIAAIQAVSGAWKSGVPAVNNIKNAIRLNGVTYLGANKALPTSMALLSTLWETDPGNPGSPFTVDQINTIEAGQQAAT